MEQEFDDLKLLFQQKKTSSVIPPRKAAERSALGINILRKDLLKNVFVFLATALVIIYIDQVSSAKMQTSSPGFWILLACSFYYALSRVYLLYRLSHLKPTQTVLQAILELENYRTLHRFVLSYGELVYVMVLSLGVYLYLQPMKPFFEKSNFKWVELALGAYILWAAFHTLVIKRNKLKRESQILEQHILALSTEN